MSIFGGSPSGTWRAVAISRMQSSKRGGRCGGDRSRLEQRICQRYFECATEDLLSAKVLMQQSLFAEGDLAAADPVSG